MARERRFGSVRRLRSGKWQARYTWDALEHKAPRTFASKDAAEAWLRTERTELDTGWILTRKRQRRSVTFGEYAQGWLEERQDLKPRTRVLLKTGAVAEMLGVSRQHVVDLCTRGDLPSIKVGAHRRIRRSDVDALLEGQAMTDEQRKQLWMHQAMLTHLLTRPEEVMGLARENIRRWSSMHRQDGRTVEDLCEWDSILTQGLEETVDTILSTSPRARELRQNSPFAGVLSHAERTQALPEPSARSTRWRREPSAAGAPAQGCLRHHQGPGDPGHGPAGSPRHVGRGRAAG